eukprot:s5365_g1.t1
MVGGNFISDSCQDLKILQQESLAFFDNESGLRPERILVAGEMEEDDSVIGPKMAGSRYFKTMRKLEVQESKWTT